MFENVKDTRQQGDIGVAAAILEFQRKGYAVSIPIGEGLKYDLIVDDGERLQKVQVKTTTKKSPNSHEYYQVRIAVEGHTKGEKFHYHPRQDGDYDFLFVLCENGDKFIIPEEALPRSGLELNAYRKYLVA